MSRNASQARFNHRNSTSSTLKDLSNKLSKIQITTKPQNRGLSNKTPSIDKLIDSISSGKYKRIVVLAGAGISTPSGIPDFRTPGTGLYDNLQRYNIPYPEAIFELSYFYRNPQPFFHLAKELYPGRYLPNIIHYFIRYLYDQKVLHRVYTQNIDGLERLAGIPSEKIVEAHGTFMTATCQRCRQKYECEEIRQKIFDDQIPKCTKTPRCTGVIKPDIVFFGEDLPRRFELYLQDLPMCDCCIVMGTSLGVYPFADIVDSTARSAVRLLINRQIVGTFLTPRSNDLMMIGDLEYSIKELLQKLNAIDKVMELMKKENSENAKKGNFQNRKVTTNNETTTSNDRLKAAEIFLEQKRKYSTLNNNRRAEISFQSQSKNTFNDSTKLMIERHNDHLLLNRQRSKSAFPVRRSKQQQQLPSSSSSSSSSDSLDSSISETELRPFAFKGSSDIQFRTVKKLVATPTTRVTQHPLLNASLRTAT